MKQQDDRKRTSALTWAIRVIIIVIFCVAVAITAVKLAEAYRTNQHNDRIQEQIEQEAQTP